MLMPLVRIFYSVSALGPGTAGDGLNTNCLGCWTPGPDRCANFPQINHGTTMCLKTD